MVDRILEICRTKDLLPKNEKISYENIYPLITYMS